MPTEVKRLDDPRDDIEELIAKTLKDIGSVENPQLLNTCRSLFRSKVPFHLRSYVASALILRAVGAATLDSGVLEKSSQTERMPREKKPKTTISVTAPEPHTESRKPSSPPRKKEEETENLRLKDGRYSGDGTTLFFSMGRRQKFTAQSALRILSNISGIEETDIGRIRTFDNYSFINVHPAAADLIIQDVDGILYRGRRLTVNRALPRKESGNIKVSESDRPAGIKAQEEPSRSLADGKREKR